MVTEARRVAIQTFEDRTYCDMQIGTFALSCRMQANGTAISCAWRQLGDGPSKPNDEMRRQSEAIAEAEFVKQKYVRAA